MRESARWIALSARVGSALASLGHPREERRSVPHVTVARVRAGARVGPDLASMLTPAISAAVLPVGLPVRDVTLYESRLHRTGARYTKLAQVPFGPPTGRPDRPADPEPPETATAPRSRSSY